MYEAKVLICELTFVAPDHRKEKIHKFGHMHLDDLVERRDRFKNELIIAAHLSTRYHAERRCGRWSSRRCPTCSTAGCTCGCEPQSACTVRLCGGPLSRKRLIRRGRWRGAGRGSTRVFRRRTFGRICGA